MINEIVLAVWVFHTDYEGFSYQNKQTNTHPGNLFLRKINDLAYYDFLKRNSQVYHRMGQYV